MDLQEIFTMQKGLDQHIETKHQLENEDLFDRKVLALLVEIGELANETRCFKFWSVKPPSPQPVILEEFVDGIHFMISLGLECGFRTTKEIVLEHAAELSMNEQFLKVYEATMLFRSNHSFEAYKEMFQNYLLLGSLLGFTEEEIKEAYISKNEVNYKRQEEGY